MEPFLNQGPRSTLFPGIGHHGYLKAFVCPQLSKCLHRLLEVLLLCVQPDHFFRGGGPYPLYRLLLASILPHLLSSPCHDSYVLHGRSCSSPRFGVYQICAPLPCSFLPLFDKFRAVLCRMDVHTALGTPWASGKGAFSGHVTLLVTVVAFQWTSSPCAASAHIASSAPGSLVHPIGGSVQSVC